MKRYILRKKGAARDLEFHEGQEDRVREFLDDGWKRVFQYPAAVYGAALDAQKRPAKRGKRKDTESETE